MTVREHQHTSNCMYVFLLAANIKIETEIVKDFLKDSRIAAEVMVRIVPEIIVIFMNFVYQILPLPVGEVFSTFTDSFTSGAQVNLRYRKRRNFC